MFSVESAGAWGFSSGPGVGIDRLQSHRPAQGSAVARNANGKIVLVRGVDASAQATVLRVASIGLPGTRVLGADVAAAEESQEGAGNDG